MATLKRATLWQRFGLPCLVGLGVFLTTLLIWRSLVEKDHAERKRAIDQTTFTTAELINEQVNSRMNALRRMAERWAYDGGTPESEWQADSQNYIIDYPGFQAVEWVDASFQVRWIVPLIGNEAARNFFLAQESRRRAALESARDRNQATMTRVIQLVQGGKGFHFYVPIYLRKESPQKGNASVSRRSFSTASSTLGKFDGFIVGVFRTEDALNNLLTQKISEGYEIAVYDGNEEIYRRYAASTTSRQLENEWAHQEEIDIYGVPWRVRVWQTEKYMAMSQSPLPLVVLGVGSGLAGLVGYVVYLAQWQKQRTAQIAVTNQTLEKEIVDRNRAEAALRRSANEIEDLYNNAACGYHSVDRDGTFIRINDTELRMLGYGRSEVIGKKKNFDFVYSEDLPAFREAFATFLERGWYKDLEYRIVRKDGSLLPVSLSATAICDSKGDFVQTRASIVDISDRKRAEEALKQSEIEFRALFAAMQDIVLVRDATGRCLKVAPTRSQNLIQVPEEMVGKTLHEVMPQPQADLILAHIQRALSHQQTVSCEYSLEVGDRDIWLATSISPLSDQTVLLVGRDITTRKRSEQVLALQNAASKALAESTTLADLSTKILPAICESIGWVWGEFWQLNPQGTHLHCLSLWSSAVLREAALPAAQLRREVQDLAFVPGSGLPGAIWVTHRPIWISDVVQDTSFVRREKAHQTGLHAAVGFPVLVDQEVLGVITCFSQHILLADPKLLDALITIGNQIGQFIKREQAETARRESEEKYRELFDNANDLIQSVAIDGRILYVNWAWQDGLGYSDADLKSLSLFDVVHPDSVDYLQTEIFPHIVSGDTVEDIEFALLAQDGRKVDVEGSLFGKQVNGEVVEIQAMLRDVSDRKRAEHAIQEYIAEVSDLYDNAPCGYHTLDTDGNFTRINATALSMLGYTQDELIGTHYSTIFTQDSIKTFNKCCPELKQNCNQTNLEFEVICKDGTRIPILLNSTAVTDESGNLISSRCSVFDIRDRKQAEQRRLQLLDQEKIARAEAENAKARLTNILNSITDAFVTLDPEWRFTYANPKAAKILQRSIPKLIGANAWNLYPSLVGSRTDQEFRRAIAEQVTVSFEEFYPSFNTWLDVRVYPTQTGLAIYFQDISDRKAMEEDLRESEERWQLVLAGNNDGIWDVEIPTQRSFRSRRWEEILGYDPGEVGTDNSTWANEIHPDDRDRILQECQDYLEKRIPVYAAEFRIRCKDGSYKWVLERSQAVWNEQGVPIRLVGSLTDISSRKKIEEDLRASEERWQLALAGNNDGIWDLDLRTFQCFRSSRWKEILGYANQEFDSHEKRWQDSVHPDDLDRVRRCQQAYLDRQLPTHSVEYRILCKNGIYKWVQERAQGVWDETDTPIRLVGSLTDISDRKQAEEAVRSLTKAMENAVVSISQINGQGVYIKVNPAYAKLLKYQPEELIGTDWQQMVHPNDRDRATEAYRTMFKKGKAEVEVQAVRKDGTVFDQKLVMVKAFDEHHNFIGHYGFMKDISDRREVERLKDEFVSIVSHELRTPLTSIAGALDLLASGILESEPQESQRMLAIASNNTERLVRMINDILDMERIESGKIAMTKQACSVIELIDDASSMIQEMANKAEVTLSTSAPTVRLHADPDRIIQVLTNLISNAIKFSPKGSTVWVSAEMMESPPAQSQADLDERTYGNKAIAGDRHSDAQTQDANLQPPQSYLCFKIQDQGRGIPADKLSLIFQPFRQVDASDSRQKGGTGLGLAICRSILQQHGGEIWVDSVMGEGSTFYFTLPILWETADQPSTVTDPTAPLVLVCDDDSSVRAVVQAILERQGYRVITATSGEEAVQQASTEYPDVILLNLMMPGMDGWKTLGTLKQHPETKNIPVIILSGLLTDDQQNQDLPVNDWLVKPPNQQSLLQALEHAITNPDSALKVLIVEDDLELAQVLVAMFNRHSIETIHARTGREAINLSESLLPDLLVLDLGLPEGDGFAVADWLQRHKRLNHVPLVVYTARDLNHDDRQRLKLGHTLFFTKGRIAPQDFEQRVVNLLNRIVQVQKGETV
jgi:PAS domain S-box-containing protein